VKVIAQGDPIEYEVSDPAQACRMYRKDMTDALIGVVTSVTDYERTRRMAESIRLFNEERKRLEADNAALFQLLADITTSEADDPCWYDHHGQCQAHRLEPKGECHMERQRALRAAPHPGAAYRAPLSAARAYRDATQACDGIAAAEQALFKALKELDR